ncbi:putative site-specific integrase-resolvase [Salirhabdus euzebyi]|uniref:Putative site-specific integrase-resolvase n=1 Tax=Salirhabdus euzebyi TaxID=394506 RepID=A0A841PSK6_9BACI|nr:hypothetical protein [Salirhabdus euzebyi]MBB6451770.1 putative site-specific integrase-resolvase [Salirhabdus euzebyi]
MYWKGSENERIQCSPGIKILGEYYITDSIQMVTRWIRQGRIKAIRSENRKEGYLINHEDLFDYIDEIRPGLPIMKAVYDSYIENLPLDEEINEYMSTNNVYKISKTQ